MRNQISLDVRMSYKTLHKFIGILAFILPLICLVQNGLKDSISSCYYTKSRDWFEITLGACGFFFFCNKGYDWKENLSNKIAGICMVLIGLCGCYGSLNIIHYVSAITLFIDLGIICLFLFTRVKVHQTYNDKKSNRNLIYQICGLAIIFLVALIGIFSYEKIEIEICESLLFWFFGISWMVQGEVFSKLNG